MVGIGRQTIGTCRGGVANNLLLLHITGVAPPRSYLTDRYSERKESSEVPVGAAQSSVRFSVLRLEATRDNSARMCQTVIGLKCLALLGLTEPSIVNGLVRLMIQWTKYHQLSFAQDGVPIDISATVSESRFQ